ncbi:MAG: Peptidase M23B [Candidatus Daviesbacteria bacterium GW2011_GWA1_41_61]|nr:MAG: Peptidase M23B [Candidatus Daviesbacteria bacterium GW2011_GWB1_41_15]KKS15266.1 MAG: Peptidase M23B [Candidatus Daviesbacteria bacterium GW2011_GWA1_41_61]
MVVLLYMAGYQPVLAIPPIKKAVVLAEFSQQQDISSDSLSQPFQLPHPGYLTQRFSSWHPGVDIATGYGMPIHPVNNGKVVEVVYSYWGLGHYVVVEHEQEYKTTYGHMGRIFVKNNDLVLTSSTLGEVGMTGNTSGPHTHLEISQNGRSTDPLTLLPAVPNWPKTAGDAPQGKSQPFPISKTEIQRSKSGKVALSPTSSPKLPLVGMTQLGFNTKEASAVNPLPRLLLSQ